MKTIAIISLIFIATLSSLAQIDVQEQNRFSRINTIQLEFREFGSAHFFLSYERFLFNSDFFKTSVQIGFARNKFGDYMAISAPFFINELLSFHAHHLEAGLGINHSFMDMEQDGEIIGWQQIGELRLGYRYQKPDGRFQYKLNFSPYYLIDKKLIYQRGLAVTLGYAF